MTKKITITIISQDNDPDVAPTLERIADQIANGFTSGFDSNDTERYNYEVEDVAP